jgi:hypothetical protein
LVASSLAPHFSRVQLHVGLLWLWRGRQEGGTGSTNEAIRARSLERAQAAFRRTLRWDPSWADAIVTALLAYPGVGVQELEGILPPEEASVRRWLAARLAGEDRPADGLRILRPLLEVEDPSVSDLLAFARLQLALRQGPEASSTLRRALKQVEPTALQETLSQAWRGLRRSGFPRLGEALCADAAAERPSDSALQRELGLALLAGGRPADAIRALEASFDGGLRASGVELGRAYLALGRKQTAAGVWERTLSVLRQGSVPLRLELSALHLELGDRDEALSVLRQGRRLAPGDRRLRDALDRLAR